jgi:anti-anti-sigma factor
MLKPRVQLRTDGGVLSAEFWDCLRLDPAPVNDLRKEFEVHLRAQGRPEVVVDLNGVAFAGSAALGGFLALNRLARQRGGRIVFCHVDPNVLEVFRVSKLVPLFAFEPDVPAALVALKSPTPRDEAEPGPGSGAANPPADGSPAPGQQAGALGGRIRRKPE